MRGPCCSAKPSILTSHPPLQAMTYRTGHHSTSDDSSRYRGAAEIQHWKLQRDPVARFRRWLQGQGWWDDAREEELRKSARAEVERADHRTTPQLALWAGKILSWSAERLGAGHECRLHKTS